jgi:uracil-DNA glycosylase
VSDDSSSVLASARALLEWEREVFGDYAPRGARSEQGVAALAPAPVARESTVPAQASAPGGAGEGRRARLDVLQAEAAGCTRCALHTTRTKSVFSRGNPDAPLVFVGEGPGYNEDQLGEPFVGQAGKLLDKMIEAMGRGPGDVYICNVVKCRPPENRTPLPPEVTACEPFLAGQLEVIAPRVLVALGKCAAQALLGEADRGWRGTWGQWRGIPVMPTYHPAFLLRSPEFKRPVWEDLQKVMARLAG